MFLRKFKGITYKYYLYSFFSGLVFYTAALIPFYTEWGHISQAQIQILQAWLMFWAFVLEIPTGVIADRFGRKSSIILGCFTSFVSFLIYGLFPNFVIFLIAEFLAALGIALISGAGEAHLYDSLKSEGRELEYKKIYGRSFSLSQVATLISAILGSIIVSYLGLNWGMLLSSVSVAIAGFFIIFTNEPNYKKSIKANSENSIVLGLKGFQIILKNKLLKSLILNGIFVYIGVYFFIWLYQPLLKSFAFPLIYYGVVRALFSFSGMIFNVNINRTENLFKNPSNFLNWTGVITVFSILVLALFPNIYTLLIVLLLLGGLGQARFSLINSHINEQIASEQRATTLSTVSMINRIILIVLNPFIGLLAEKSISFALIVVAIIIVIAIVIFPVRLRTNTSSHRIFKI